mmetsp:Transcript_9426/g.23022  ORF Transcript_9426/g.23022 Transcript_9426/m.23022 type:complete len:311 (-) Transcript_9426:233-1165(-)
MPRCAYSSNSCSVPGMLLSRTALTVMAHVLHVNPGARLRLTENLSRSENCDRGSVRWQRLHVRWVCIMEEEGWSAGIVSTTWNLCWCGFRFCGLDSCGGRLSGCCAITVFPLMPRGTTAPLSLSSMLGSSLSSSSKLCIASPSASISNVCWDCCISPPRVMALGSLAIIIVRCRAVAAFLREEASSCMDCCCLRNRETVTPPPTTTPSPTPPSPFCDGIPLPLDAEDDFFLDFFLLSPPLFFLEVCCSFFLLWRSFSCRSSSSLSSSSGCCCLPLLPPLVRCLELRFFFFLMLLPSVGGVTATAGSSYSA